MANCLAARGYLALIDDQYMVTTKLFEMAHVNPPTHRLLSKALPIMQKLSSELDQSCQLTVYNQGRQIVVAKVDSPSGMGFSIRLGAELDVLVSTSGRELLAFQDLETRRLRKDESMARRPDHGDAQMDAVLDMVKSRGFEVIPSVQVRGLYAVSWPAWTPADTPSRHRPFPLLNAATSSIEGR
jgi:DNA-binding IclR family transcriptional regulator